MRLAAWAVVAMMVLTAAPASAASPRGSLEVPDPTDWGVRSSLLRIQDNESAALNDPQVVSEAGAMLADVVAVDGTPTPVEGYYDLRGSSPPPVQRLDLIPTIESSPYSNLTNFFSIILDQPLKLFILVKSGEHVNWVETRLWLLMSLAGSIARGPVMETLQPWEYVNVDNDTTTGDANGDDIAIRIGPTIATTSWRPQVLPLGINWTAKGGLEVEIQRLDPDAEPFPVEATFIKPFKYSNINYTWFVEYKVERTPLQTSLTLTADSLDLSVERGDFRDRLIEALRNIGSGGITNISLNTSAMTRLAGPYNIEHNASESMGETQASLGYIKLKTETPADEVEVEEASWLTVKLSRAEGEDTVPRWFEVWLDSPSFNRSFDHLRWTSEHSTRLDIGYYDDRENYTQARGFVDAAPDYFEIEIENETTDGRPNTVIHYVASDVIDRLAFDEWEFYEGSRTTYLHSHVEIEGMPTELWVNGTLDIGGQVFSPLRPDPTVRNIIPQVMDGVMVRLASKLFTIGRTLRSLPQNILEMPDREGFTSIELPNEGERVAMLELWLTSNHRVAVPEGSMYFAFYNDTLDQLVGNMVETAFSARLLDVISFHADFSGTKRVEMESRYNREFRALFVDPKNQANASLSFSNIPHNLTIELGEDQVFLGGDGSIDRVQYTSYIAEQYQRLRLDGVPGNVRVHQGETATGVTIPVGEIDTLSYELSTGPVRRMGGDHLLIELNADGTTAASARISGLRSLLVERGEENRITMDAAGGPLGVLVHDEPEGFDLRAKVDPLPATLQADVSDILGLQGISFPSLSDLTSVVDFISVIYAVRDLGNDVISALGDVSTTLVDSLGTFASEIDFDFLGGSNLDVAATVTRTGPVEVEEPPWVHGVCVNQAALAGNVFVDAKVYLTGLPPSGHVHLSADETRTELDMRLDGFAPAHDTVYLAINGAREVDKATGRDVRLLLTDLKGPMDLELSVDVDADLSMLGDVRGDVALAASAPLGPMHLRVLGSGETVTAADLLLDPVPGEAELDFAYTGDINLTASLSEPVELVFLKVSRDVAGDMAPTASVTLHDVPRTVAVSTGMSGSFDMDADSPLQNLPLVSASCGGSGLDVLVDIEGRALGNKADVFLDARDVKDMSMTPSGDEYRVSAEELAFAHLRLSDLAYSEDIQVDRMDLAATNLRSVVLRVFMVFGVYPLLSVKDLSADGLQATLRGHAELMGKVREVKVDLFELPSGLSGWPRSHSNGLAVGASDGSDRILVPAPVGTLLGTLMG